jgi:predicted PurR-regulated permease PerM
MRNNRTPFVIVVSQVILGIWALFYILYIGQRIILPIIYALIFAILLNPVVNFLHRHNINRVIAILLSILAAIIFTGGVVYFIGMEISQLKETFPALQQKIDLMVNDLAHWSAGKFSSNPENIISSWEKLKTQGIHISGALIGRTLLTVTGILTIVFLIPVYVFMFLFYKPLLLEFIGMLFHKEKQEMVADVLLQTRTLIQSYLIGLLIEALIIATLNSIALLILGIQYAVLLGVIGAIVNVIPYIGGILAILFPVIMAIATKSPVYALWVVASYIVIQFIDNHYIIPKIVASKVKINALISIIVVLIGGALWGVPGMFLSIPLTALIKVVLDRVEPLKPLGFLLGDTMPRSKKVTSRMKKKNADPGDIHPQS